MSKKSITSKFHWYDGIIYDKIIAPNQKKLFGQIIDLIEPESTLLDVGCGTGFFSFQVESKCKSIVGIDLSKRNIDHANKNLSVESRAKLSFRQTNIESLLDEPIHFDYAVLTYVIHEVNENERIPLLKAIAKVADKIIIGDYLVPQPKSISGKMTEIIEFFAGKEHYINFKDYEKNGGIHYLANASGLKIQQEIKNKTNTIVLLTN